MFPEAILFVAQTNPQVCYMHSEGILSGELKHGPLALVDENMPCIILMTKDRTYTKSHNALQQVSARHVSTIGPHLILRPCSMLHRNQLLCAQQFKHGYSHYVLSSFTSTRQS